jgi:predicted MFS family arabinose efflux permease
LITYPIAGFMGAKFGMPATFVVLAAITIVGVAVAAIAWPANDPDVIEHRHTGLADQEHLHQGGQNDTDTHEHVFVIDEHHRRWPD